MESYNFWQDFFDTYQSLPDWLKALWLIIPPAFILGLVGLIARLKTDRELINPKTHGELVYLIYQDDKVRLYSVSHEGHAESPPSALPGISPSRGEIGLHR
ncbi:hypothetical protein [Phyllobacterium leguminum]|uniref:Uncharacterized protein n=1 Tax=Phyllobacterium leguminum TaxID=314237 RepID=A0A318T7W9_9HYPH|nr:hypothetical protein [Phyllobacterium leguminum]PYE86656.1 hypothetical protein C7477_12121 [Phyllobacterium leguminum]